jgi:hypothetical protein
MEAEAWCGVVQQLVHRSIDQHSYRFVRSSAVALHSSEPSALAFSV